MYNLVFPLQNVIGIFKKHFQQSLTVWLHLELDMTSMLALNLASILVLLPPESWNDKHGSPHAFVVWLLSFATLL